MRESPITVSFDTIRYDKRLSPMARIFYAEICGNISINSGCPINDDYFANLYGVTPRQVRSWRTELKDYDYIFERQDKIVGTKFMFPRKFDYEEQVKTYQIKKKFDVTYTTANGTISNAEEGYKHFHPLIEASTIPKSYVPSCTQFFDTFINSLFDIDYYNKKFTTSKFETTREFFQYVIDVIDPMDVYQNAQTIFRERFASINQVTYYVIACLVNIFKDEYQAKAEKKFYLSKRRSEKEKQLKKILEENNKKAIAISMQIQDSKQELMKKQALEEFKREN